ncbi:MAG: hypothetical protein RIA63_09525, partial [Cyclobacteriaceae bacterium]
MKLQFSMYVFLIFGSLVFFGCGDGNKLEEAKQVEVFAEDLYGGTGGISVDAQGNVYSSDFGPFLGSVKDLLPQCKIFKITPDGKVTVFADSIKGASGSHFDAEGNLFQSNIISREISKITPGGEKSVYSADSLFSPVGVIVSDSNELVVCNCGNNTLRKISSDGQSKLFAKSDLLKCPNGIALDRNGNYYVSNFYDSSIVKVNPEGEASILAKIPGNNNGHINYYDGYLYVVARAAHQIYKVDLDGKVELFAGSGKRGRTDGNRLEASFNFPNDLDFSPDHKFLYVNEEADTLSDHRILTPTVVRRI